MQIDHISHGQLPHLLCELYAKLILLVIFHDLTFIQGLFTLCQEDLSQKVSLHFCLTLRYYCLA